MRAVIRSSETLCACVNHITLRSVLWNYFSWRSPFWISVRREERRRRRRKRKEKEKMALKRINKVTKTNNPTVLSLLFVFLRPFFRLSLDFFSYLDVNFAFVVFVSRGAKLVCGGILSDLLHLCSACFIDLCSASCGHPLVWGVGRVCRIYFRLSQMASSQFILRGGSCFSFDFL